MNTPSEAMVGCGVLRKLSRYYEAPNNALTELIVLQLTDIQVQQVVDMLHDNHQLKKLSVERSIMV